MKAQTLQTKKPLDAETIKKATTLDALFEREIHLKMERDGFNSVLDAVVKILAKGLPKKRANVTKTADTKVYPGPAEISTAVETAKRITAHTTAMNKAATAKHSSGFCAKEFKIVALRDCPVDNPICDNPFWSWNYWHNHIATHPYFMPQVESLFVILMNTRKRVIGHQLVSTGTLDTILVHPREVFRAAVFASAAAVVVMHNHPSGDPAPSEADIKVTRDLIRAGQLMKIELEDHIVIGKPSIELMAQSPHIKSLSKACGYASLKELGFFYA